MVKEDLEKLITEGLSTYEIAESLETSQTNVRHWLKKYKLSTNPKKDKSNGLCIVCDKPLEKQQVMFCSGSCKQKKHQQRKKEDNPNTSYSQLKRGADRKAMLVIERGGGCEICGYKKNIGALQFHHVKDKTFTLDMRTMGNLNIDRIREEAGKCTVLCANCHAEEHYPHLENWKENFEGKEANKQYHLKTKAQKMEENKYYCACGASISYSSKQCKPCLSLLKRANRPPIEQVREDLKTMSFVAVGHKYGVSDNAVRKWLK